jgi:hypothetical protein
MGVKFNDKTLMAGRLFWEIRHEIEAVGDLSGWLLFF